MTFFEKDDNKLIFRSKKLFNTTTFQYSDDGNIDVIIEYVNKEILYGKVFSRELFEAYPIVNVFLGNGQYFSSIPMTLEEINVCKSAFVS